MYNYKLVINRHENDEFPAVFMLDSDVNLMNFDNEKNASNNKSYLHLEENVFSSEVSSVNVLEKIYNTFVFISDDIENIKKDVEFSIISKESGEAVYSFVKEAKRANFQVMVKESNIEDAALVKRLSIEF